MEDPDRNSDWYVFWFQLFICLVLIGNGIANKLNTLNLDAVQFIVYIGRLKRIPYVSGQYDRMVDVTMSPSS